MLAVPGMPSKLTDGAAMSGLIPALVLDDWTAASPAKPRPAAAGPRSDRFIAPALGFALSACVPSSRMDGDTSKPAALVDLVVVPLLVALLGAAGAPRAVLIGAEMSRPVTSSSGTSQRARFVRIRTPTVGSLLLAMARRRRCRTHLTHRSITTPWYV